MLNTNPCAPTPAEVLLACARSIKLPAGQLLVVQPGVQDWQVAQWKVAMDFDRMPLSFKFRAVFEEWTEERIVSEMYI